MYSYYKLNQVIKKDHFPLPYLDQVHERIVWHEFYCFLHVYSGYYQIDIALKDHGKTIFTCPLAHLLFE